MVWAYNEPMVAVSAPLEAAIGALTRRIRTLKFAKAACLAVSAAAAIDSVLMLLDRVVIILIFDPLIALRTFHHKLITAGIVSLHSVHGRSPLSAGGKNV